MESFQMEEHTGDVKMRVFGATREEVFAHAAKGMMTFLYGEEAFSCAPTEHGTVTIESSNSLALLVDWLAELLYLSDTYNRAYVGYTIRSLSETALTAEVASCAAEAFDDIKAVTYHELSCEKINDHWEATVVFDV